MPLFKKILHPTDFSPLADYSLNYVKKLKEAGAKEVVLIHVVESLSVELPEGADLLNGNLLSSVLPEVDQKFVSLLIEKLEKVKKELEKEGFKVKAILRYGTPGEEIVKAAEENSVSLIVMGAHGKSLLSEILIGSVSVDVSRKAKCPVLIIKKREE